MFHLLFWIYLVNAMLLINHEIDSAYWKEWDLFKLKGGITGFLWMHFPLLFLVLWGLVQVREQSAWGLALSASLGIGGLGCYLIHTTFIRKGHPEFTLPLSRWLIRIIGLVSILQLSVTGYLIFAA